MEGRWVLTEPFNNMDQILDALEMTDPQIRGFVTQIRPEIIFTPSGSGWNYKMVTPQKTREVTFKSGDEIDYVSIVGKPVKSKMEVDGNILKETHVDPTNQLENTIITRVFDGNVMNTTLEVKGIVSVGKYERA